MNRMIKLLPELQGEEMVYIQQITKELDDDQAAVFANIYRARRKDPQTILIMCIVGLFVIPGIQRFLLNQIGMGILYLLTIGLCFIGSIIDLITYQKLAMEYNKQIVHEIFGMMEINDRRALTS